MMPRAKSDSQEAVGAKDEGDTVFIVDDDTLLRQALMAFLELEGFRVRAYASPREFLAAYDPHWQGCLILDVGLPDMDGLAVQEALSKRGAHLPIIFLTGQGDIPMAVQAVKAGAVDFLEKPASDEQILGRLRAALTHEEKRRAEGQGTPEVLDRYERLTERQREVMALVTTGLSNKQIARRLGISVRTVEGHRLRIMERMRAASLWELTDMAEVCKVHGGPVS